MRARIDATSGALLATAFSVATGMQPELAVGQQLLYQLLALMVYTDVLEDLSYYLLCSPYRCCYRKIWHKSIERNYLLGCNSLGTTQEPLPVFLALALGGSGCSKFFWLIANNAQWLADGLILAGKMLPGVGFGKILLRYLPIKKNLHYLGLGFAITAILKVIFDYIEH